MKVRPLTPQVTDKFLRTCIDDGIPLLANQDLIFTITPTEAFPEGYVGMAKGSIIMKSFFVRALVAAGNNPVVLTNYGKPQYLLTRIDLPEGDTLEYDAPLITRATGVFRSIQANPESQDMIRRVFKLFEERFGITLEKNTNSCHLKIPTIHEEEFSLEAPTITFPVSLVVINGVFIELRLGHYRLRSKSPEGFTDDVLFKAVYKAFNLQGAYNG